MFWKKILTILCISVVAASCSKKDDNDGQENSGSKYYIRFKDNGSQVELKAEGRIGAGFQERVYNRPYEQFILEGYGAEFEAYPGLQIHIQDQKKIVVDSLYKSSSSDRINVRATTLYYSQAVNTYQKVIHYMKCENVLFRITKVTDLDISGTFSGTAITADGTKKTVITEGSFFAKRG